MWTYILGPEVPPEHLDESTVLALQLLNPAELSQDCKAIEDLFSEYQVFSLVKNSTIRAALEQRVLTCKRIVSLESFFADFKLLRACFDGMKLLLPRERRKKSRKNRKQKENDERSFRKKFEHNFGGQAQADFGNCYEDLWLWAMSQFPYLSDSKFSRPLKHAVSNGGQPGFYGCSDSKKAQLAYKAHELWFRTEEISHLMATSQREDLHQNPISGGLDRPLERRERMGRPTADSFKLNSRYLKREHVFSRLGSTGNERYPSTFLFWRDIAQCCWRTEARWVLAPAHQEYNNASNYNDRRARAQDEDQRKRQRRRRIREDGIGAELTKQRAMARNAQHRGSEPRARRLAEGVGTSVLTPRTQETCEGSVSVLEDSIQKFLRDVPETSSQNSQLSGSDDEKMEDKQSDHAAEDHLGPSSSSVENLGRKDGEELFRRRSEGPCTGRYHLLNLEGDRDEMRFSVEPLKPKARHSTDSLERSLCSQRDAVGAGDAAQDQVHSEQEIFEDDDNKTGDVIADYLHSGANDECAPISRTSSVYSFEEDSINEARRVESHTLNDFAALKEYGLNSETPKDESATGDENQNLELRKRDKDKAATEDSVRIPQRPPQVFRQEDIADRTVETPMILIRPASFDSATAQDPGTFTKQSDRGLPEPERPEASGSTLLGPDPNRPITQIFLSSEFDPIGNRGKQKGAIVSETQTPARDRVPSAALEVDKSSKEQSESAESKQKDYVPLTRSEMNLSSVEHGSQSGSQSGHNLLHQHLNSPNADGASSSGPQSNRLTQIALREGITPLGLTDMAGKKRKRKENEGFKFKPRRQ